jgi:GT2 family glycosyltransferase
VPPRVSVVIPNWNGEALLPRCLGSLRQQSFQEFELILVDNGSVDRSLTVAREVFPDLHLLRFSHNRGFSVAVNAGIAAASGVEIALLNSDVELDAGWLAALTRALDAHPEMSALASKMIQARDRRRLDGIGIGCLAGGIGYPIGSHEVDDGQYAEPLEVLGPCAGAALYRRCVFETAGLFDEDFFAYHEDVDLTLRSRWVGLRCLFVPTAVAYHVGGGSTGGTMNALIARLSTRNRYWVLLKNLPGAMLLRALPRLLGYEAFWARRLAARGLLRAYVQGLREGLAGLGPMRAKRQKIAQTRRIPVAEFRRAVRASERMVLVSLARRYAHRRALAGALRWGAAWGLP